MDMKTGIQSVIKWLGLLVLFLGVFRVNAQHHTDFIPVAIPSPHMLEKSIAFDQDSQGQTWLVTEQGLSVFREFQFISYRPLQFGSAVESAKIIGHNILSLIHI